MARSMLWLTGRQLAKQIASAIGAAASAHAASGTKTILREFVSGKQVVWRVRTVLAPEEKAGTLILHSLVKLSKPSASAMRFPPGPLFVSRLLGLAMAQQWRKTTGDGYRWAIDVEASLLLRDFMLTCPSRGFNTVRNA